MASCAAPQTSYFFSDDFSDSEVRLVTAALDKLPVGPSAPSRVEFYKFDSVEFYGRACVDCDPCAVRLSKWLPKAYFVTVVWHEYGHCVGFGHDKTGIMAPVVRPLSSYSDEEVFNFMESLK